MVSGVEPHSESREKKIMSYYVYILRTSSNTLYIGQTNNLAKRLKEHQGKSSKSAQDYNPERMVSSNPKGFVQRGH